MANFVVDTECGADYARRWTASTFELFLEEVRVCGASSIVRDYFVFNNVEKRWTITLSSVASYLHQQREFALDTCE